MHPSCHVQKELWSSRHHGLVVLTSLIQPLLSLLPLSPQYNGGLREVSLVVGHPTVSCSLNLKQFVDFHNLSLLYKEISLMAGEGLLYLNLVA